MNTDLVERAMQIFEDVFDRDVDARREHIKDVCNGDQKLQHEVELLLENTNGVKILGIEDAENSAVEELAERLFESCSPNRYALHEEIGRGGMGVVFRAYDDQLDREIAVKVLQESSKDKLDALRRFANEAQIAAQLQHPGIAPVHDVGRLTDGRAFLAMKLVKGETMASRFSDRNKPTDNRAELLAVFEQLCQTIAYAHANGIIHRDLKPDNVMVGEFGEESDSKTFFARISCTLNSSQNRMPLHS